MSTAVAISLLAVGICLMVVFMARNAAKAKADRNGDGGTATSDGSSSSDCGSEGGGCD